MMILTTCSELMTLKFCVWMMRGGGGRGRWWRGGGWRRGGHRGIGEGEEGEEGGGEGGRGRRNHEVQSSYRDSLSSEI